MNDTLEIPLEVGARAIADLIGISTQRLGQLVKAGVLPKAARGRYHTHAVVAAYLDFRVGESARRDRSQSTDALRDARAAEIRLRIAKQERELIPLEETMADFEEMTGMFVTMLETLPAQITRDVRERNRIVAIIDANRERLRRVWQTRGRNTQRFARRVAPFGRPVIWIE